MTGYVADLSWKSGARAIEKLDRLRSTMAVNVLRIFCLQSLEKASFACCNNLARVKMKVKVWKGSIGQFFCKTRWNNKINWEKNTIQQNQNSGFLI